MVKDPDRLIKVERAIAEKYGEETTRNPHSFWDKETEKNFLQELKKVEEKHLKRQQESEKVEFNGVLLPKKLVSSEETSSRTCAVCGVYSFDSRDDLYMSKFECCNRCYIEHIEGREDKWQYKKNKLLTKG